MVAAPFVGTVKVVGKDGWAYAYPITCDDTAATPALFPDGSGDLILPGVHGNVQVFDFINNAAGTTTSQLAVYVNGVDTGLRLVYGLNLATNISRQLMGAPVNISPGAKLKLVQLV